MSLRARTDFPVLLKNGSLRTPCRGVEVSATGIILDRGRVVTDADMCMFSSLELRLPERSASLCSTARPVWSFGQQQAFRFLDMSDSDRLSLAEHLDLLAHRNVTLS
jgi:hypothetical protein